LFLVAGLTIDAKYVHMHTAKVTRV
jgi:hypothetical protein